MMLDNTKSNGFTDLASRARLDAAHRRGGGYVQLADWELEVVAGNLAAAYSLCGGGCCSTSNCK